MMLGRMSRLAAAMSFAAASLVAPAAHAAHNEPPVLQAFSGDCTTTANSYTLTCTKFNGGTAFGSMAGQNASNVAVTGGTIDGTVIGATTRAAISATTLSLTGALTGTTGTFTGLLSGATNSFSGLSTQTGGHVVGTGTFTGTGTMTTAQEEACVTASAATTITLPASPTIGEKHRVADCGYNAATFNITVKASTGNVENSSSGVTLTVNGQSEDFTYWGSTIGWKEG